jgi:hypothetical protein
MTFKDVARAGTHIKNRLPIWILLCLQGAAGSALAQSGPDALAGRWVVTWNNNSKNPVTLTLTSGRFKGIYENDGKEACSLTGNFQPSNRRLAFQIVCPRWDIRMQGVASRDARTISGSYQAYVDATGTFTMTKQ